MAVLSPAQVLAVAFGTAGAVSVMVLHRLLQAVLGPLGRRAPLPWGGGTGRPPSWGGPCQTPRPLCSALPLDQGLI